MTYQFREGYRGAVSPEVAGERLARLRAANDDHLTPAIVVDDARPDDAPLHPCFEWDDEVAAEKFREDEARRLIRYTYLSPDHRAGSLPTLQYIHVRLPEVGPCYVTTARAVAEDDLREQVEADALKAFQALRERYRHIQGLADVFAAIDAIAKPPKTRDKPVRRVAVATA